MRPSFSTLLSFLLLVPVFSLFSEESPLLQEFLKENLSKQEITSLQEKVLALKSDAVPTLITVIKESRFPDKNRWPAVFLLGRIMGKEAAPFLAKFLNHPHWPLRLASLKTLINLKCPQYADLYAQLLFDESLLIRFEAISAIKQLNLTSKALDIWKMLYQTQNYQDIEGKKKRMPILSEVILAMGDLKEQSVKNQLMTMIQKDHYDDLFDSLNYALIKLTGMTPPKGGDRAFVKAFWRRASLPEKNF